MRKETPVDLGANCSVIVRELRVRDMRALVDKLQDLQALADIPLPTLLSKRLPDLLALAGDSLALPEGTTVDDLSLSECLDIKDAWWDLHKAFFAPLVALLGDQIARKLAARTASPGATSTAPPSPASSAGTSTSGTTAGPST